MRYLIILLIILILLLLEVNCELRNEIKIQQENDKKYYNHLRSEFDKRIKDLQDDIELNNEIIEGWNSIYKEGEYENGG
jgi:hypothetical protein